MKLKHRDIKKSANYGFWKRMKARTASVWEKAKRKTTYALAGAVVAAALSAAPGCDKHPGTDPQPDATVQQDSTVQRDSTADAQTDSQVPDASPPCPDPVPETLAWNQNLVGDYMNRMGGDREGDNSSADPDQAYPIGGPDTDPDANPFTNGIGGNIGPTEEFMHKVGSADATPFADVTLTDYDANLTYTEQQALWIRADNRFDTDPDAVVGQVGFIAYSLKFDDGTGMGIPSCTTADATGDYNSCLTLGGNYDDASVSHRLMVSFLGEQWLLIGLNAPADTNVTTGQEVRNGGSARLAKESMGGILNLMEWLAVDNIKFQLFNVEEQGGVRMARIAVLDEFNNIIGMNMVAPGQTVEFNISGNTYKLHVYKVAPAYSIAQWADMSILSREIELVDGQEMDQNNGSNPAYTVSLGWKNRDASLGSGRPDSLRTMVVYSDSIADLSSSGDNVLEEGDYIPIAQDPETWRLGYAGLDITSADVETLRFEMNGTDRIIPASRGPLVGGEQAECTLSAPYAEVYSGGSPGPVFDTERSDVPGVLSDDEFYVILSAGGTCSSSQGTLSLDPGTILMKLAPNSDNYGLSESMMVTYDAIGKTGNVPLSFGPPNGGMIVIDVGQEGGPVTQLLESAGADCTAQCIDPADITGSKPNVMFAISEYAGAGYVDYHVFGAAMTGTGNAADATFAFDSFDGSMSLQLTSDASELLYGHATANCNDYYGGPLSSGPVESGMELVEPGYISERGSTFMTISNNTVDFEMSHTLGKATWTLVWNQ